MKNQMIAVLAVLYLLSNISCNSSPSSISTTSRSPGISTPQYFTGDGGKDMSLAVLVPSGTGLADEQNYIPTLVQGVLVGDISKYSAISVLDRMKLETVLIETESGIYRDNASYGRLGEIAEVDYALTGSITRTSTGYAMQIQVVGTGRDNIGVTRASYSGNCTIAEFDNFTGIRRASLELLTQLGINLTDSARSELSGRATASEINAQQALSKGIIEQRDGNEWDALFSYFEARTFNPFLQEASSRITSANTTLSTNNWNNTGWSNTGARSDVLSEIERMREDARLQHEAEQRRIERRQNIIELLRKATDFYKKQQPFIISFSQDTFYYSNINHINGTVDITVGIKIEWIESERKIIEDLMRLARSIGIYNWPFHYTIRPTVHLLHLIPFQGTLQAIFYYVEFPKNNVPGIWKTVCNLTKCWYIEPQFTIAASVTNDTGKEIKRLSFKFSESYFTDFDNIDADDDFNSLLKNNTVLLTFPINVDDLTDILTVRIISVNRKSIDNIRQNGLIGIAQEAIQMPGQRR